MTLQILRGRRAQQEPMGELDDCFEQAEKWRRTMRLAEALQAYEAAEVAGYDADACAGGRWTCRMLLGDFERAWRESDAIQKRAKPDPYRFWNGCPFDGRRVLIRCLHGLGDTIQFIRYAPLLRQKAAAVTIEAQPTLKRLIAESQLGDCVFTWGEREPEWDQQMEVVELPRIFRTTQYTIPANVPYIDAPCSAEQAGDDGETFGDGKKALRVGVVWAGGDYNLSRSIPFEKVERLFRTAGALFFSLQAGEERAQLAAWSGRVVDCYDPAETPFELAQRMKTLDLVITADTMAAHLAGAMAKPVWTLVPFQCDWRWMTEREDSPWYPTMRLFRQPSVGDWATVVERTASELEKMIRQESRRGISK